MKDRIPAPGRSIEMPGIPATTLVISVVLHLAGFGAAIGLPRLLPHGRDASPVYVVDLVSLPAGGATAPPGPGPAAPARKAAPPPPKPEKPVKLPEPRAARVVPKPAPGKKPPEPKKPESKPSPEDVKRPDKNAKPEPVPPVTAAGGAPAPEGPAAAAAGAGRAPGAGAPGGGAGGTGTGSGQADAETFYAGLLKHRIEDAWNRPIFPPDWTGATEPTATVRIVITASGRATEVALVTPSGYEAMDRSIMRAVQEAQPFPPFPAQLGRDSLTVSIDFLLPPK